MNWTYKGVECVEPPEDAYGFIYKVTCIDKKSEHFGWEYIGKKAFSHVTKKKLSKKARVGTRKKVTKVSSDSGWKKYFGSSLLIKEDVLKLGENKFKREILHFCPNKSMLSYMEVVEIINNKVLLKDSYNGWMSCKIYKKFLI